MRPPRSRLDHLAATARLSVPMVGESPAAVLARERLQAEGGWEPLLADPSRFTSVVQEASDGTLRALWDYRLTPLRP
jgi:hypothetical protein